MIAAFAKSQIDAKKAIEQGNEGFAEGGYTGDGGKHEAAGTVHKGEFVNTKEDTRKHRNLLEGIHQDDERMMKAGLVDLIRNKGISLSDELPEMINNKKQIVRQSEINAYLKTDNSTLEKEVREMKEVLNQILAENQQKNYTDQNGNLVVKGKTHKEVFKK